MKMPNMAMLQKAQQMQQRMQEEIAAIKVDASAGGGTVTVSMNGHKQITAVKIDPEAAGDAEMLQDLILAACNEAFNKVEAESKSKMSSMNERPRPAPRIVLTLMADFAAPLQRLIDEFRRLPGVGQKSAQRLGVPRPACSPRTCGSAGRCVDRSQRQPRVPARSATISRIRNCARIAVIRIAIPASICVVEEPHNILPIETTRSFSGLYHVLLGSISPLRGIGPEQLRIKGLLDRITQGEAKEIILATNPTVEGEATAAYLSRLLKPLGVRVTRIAMGIPVGSDLEFADEVTMLKSLENRREM